MILRALSFQGSLDVSAPEQIGETDDIFFRKTVTAGQTFYIDNSWYSRIPNIKNAVSSGYLEIVEGDPDDLEDNTPEENNSGGAGDVTLAGNNTFTGTNTFSPTSGSTILKDTSGTIALQIGSGRVLKDSLGNTIFNFATQAETISEVTGGDVQDGPLRDAFNDLVAKLKTYGIIKN